MKFYQKVDAIRFVNECQNGQQLLKEANLGYFYGNEDSNQWNDMTAEDQENYEKWFGTFCMIRLMHFRNCESCRIV